MSSSSSNALPTELNFLAPFLGRATEMAESQPVMAYYCKFYAVSLALKGPNKFKRTPQTDTFLADLFDSLEAEKAALSTHPAINDLAQGAIYVRELAYRVFLSAERLESAPETLKKAPQSYLAALNFLQIYRGVFLEDGTDEIGLGPAERSEEIAQVDEKSKYAKWRIIEIKKSLAKAKDSPMSPSISNYTTQPQSQQPQPQVQMTQSPIQSQTQPHSIQSQVQSPTINQLSPVLAHDPKIVSECERHARHAISALNFDDFETAAENLKTALKILQPLLSSKKGE